MTKKGKITKQFAYIISLIFLYSCSSPSRLEQALEFAGDNRHELEKVLNHYNKHPEDSLKYKAAYFLIENMPHHYAYDSKKLQNFRTEFYKTGINNNNPLIGEEAFKLLEKKYGMFSYDKTDKIFDSHIITSEYLIRDIDFSFDTWQKSAWKTQINFDDFCNHILPYRVSHEPLEDWREAYYNKFSPILDSLLITKNDPISACQILYDEIVKDEWVFFQNNPIPGMGAGVLLHDRVGSCIDRTELATYIMRALGILGGCDYRIQNPFNSDAGHSWSFVKDSVGNCIEYTYYDQRPLSDPEIEWKKGRVYRQCFGVQKTSLPIQAEGKQIPPKLNNLLIIDVTHKYIKGCTLDIDTPKQVQDKEFIYLCVFNNREWIPITWSRANERKATFSNVDKGIIYLPAYYTEKGMKAISDPILVNEDGTFQKLTAKTDRMQELVLSRKYPIKPWWDWYIDRSVGGRFEGANNAAFKNPALLHVITHQLDMRWHKVEVKDPIKFRYIRYVSANKGCCNMAEIEFMSPDNQILKGKVIGTEGSHKNDPKYTKTSVFDNNTLTFFDAKEPSGSWVGLDFGEPKSINEIKYIFRNDDNNIRINDSYELVYWNNGNWESMGVKTANQDTLVYPDCPTGALFLLHNHSRGNEERIFLYENGKQIWW